MSLFNWKINMTYALSVRLLHVSLPHWNISNTAQYSIKFLQQVYYKPIKKPISHVNIWMIPCVHIKNIKSNKTVASTMVTLIWSTDITYICVCRYSVDTVETNDDTNVRTRSQEKLININKQPNVLLYNYHWCFSVLILNIGMEELLCLIFFQFRSSASRVPVTDLSYFYQGF